jgi:hypothetical protein
MSLCFWAALEFLEETSTFSPGQRQNLHYVIDPSCTLLAMGPVLPHNSTLEGHLQPTEIDLSIPGSSRQETARCVFTSRGH